MSTRRLAIITTVPMPIKKAFRTAEPATTGEERLWRERAARMTLDALGHTNLTVKPHEHNEAVRYARRWFRGFYAGVPPNAKGEPQDDNPGNTFDAAAVLFAPVREAVLAEHPIIFEPEDGD